MEFVNRREHKPSGMLSRRLIRRWRSLSSRSYWKVPQDWWTPEVECIASLGRRNPALIESARSLGAARCRQGVGVTEALTDFRCYFKASMKHVDLNVVQAFVEGWVSEAEDVEQISCTDPATGLSTRAHFSKTLYDLKDQSTSEQMLLATVTLVPQRTGTVPLGWTQLASLGSIFLQSFSGIDATMMHEGRTVYVLASRTPALFATLLNCQAQITLSKAFRDFQTTIACEALPQQSRNFHQLLKSMQR
ncbi:hypothetical protein [Psychromicrobium sp. YIM B11713]|uniref:hypothetical protein n=1 Tax=Psychromicrobium sp. YIM B11713 TaxID=3145233 RepID=UPI00374F899C